MTHHVYKTIQLTGSSQKSAEDAICTAIDKANQTVHNLRWFRVTDTRGQIENGKIAHWQVSIELGFTLK